MVVCGTEKKKKIIENKLSRPEPVCISCIQQNFVKTFENMHAHLLVINNTCKINYTTFKFNPVDLRFSA